MDIRDSFPRPHAGSKKLDYSHFADMVGCQPGHVRHLVDEGLPTELGFPAGRAIVVSDAVTWLLDRAFKESRESAIAEAHERNLALLRQDAGQDATPAETRPAPSSITLDIPVDTIRTAVRQAIRLEAQREREIASLRLAASSGFLDPKGYLEGIAELSRREKEGGAEKVTVPAPDMAQVDATITAAMSFIASLLVETRRAGGTIEDVGFRILGAHVEDGVLTLAGLEPWTIVANEAA